MKKELNSKNFDSFWKQIPSYQFLPLQWRSHLWRNIPRHRCLEFSNLHLRWACCMCDAFHRKLEWHRSYYINYARQVCFKNAYPSTVTGMEFEPFYHYYFIIVIISVVVMVIIIIFLVVLIVIIVFIIIIIIVIVVIIIIIIIEYDKTWWDFVQIDMRNSGIQIHIQ